MTSGDQTTIDDLNDDQQSTSGSGSIGIMIGIIITVVLVFLVIGILVVIIIIKRMQISKEKYAMQLELKRVRK